MSFFGTSMKEEIIEMRRICGLPYIGADEFHDEMLKAVAMANDLVKTAEFLGNKKASAAAACYATRIPIKIMTWKLFDTYDTDVEEDRTDETLLSFLNSEQKNIVREFAQVDLRNAQSSWRRRRGGYYD